MLDTDWFPIPKQFTWLEADQVRADGRTAAGLSRPGPMYIGRRPILTELLDRVLRAITCRHSAAACSGWSVASEISCSIQRVYNRMYLHTTTLHACCPSSCSHLPTPHSRHCAPDKTLLFTGTQLSVLCSTYISRMLHVFYVKKLSSLHTMCKDDTVIRRIKLQKSFFYYDFQLHHCTISRTLLQCLL